jgi:hypothetical protein
MDMTAAALRRRLKAEVQRRIEGGEICESDALDLFDCLVREAKLGPRPVDDFGAI